MRKKYFFKLAFIVQFHIVCMLMNSYKNVWIVATRHVESIVLITNCGFKGK